MIKVIIFDYGGVVAGTKSEESGLIGLCKLFSKVLNLPIKQVYNAYKKQWNDWKLAKLTINQVYNNFLKDINSSYPKDKLIEITLNYSSLNKQLVNLILKLKKRYKVACLTNHAREWFTNEIKRFDLDSLFDDIFTSYELEIDKPNPMVYKMVLKKLNVKPEECLFIDDLKRNTKPAAKLGINTIVFKSYLQLKKELIKLGVMA